MNRIWVFHVEEYIIYLDKICYFSVALRIVRWKAVKKREESCGTASAAALHRAVSAKSRT
jgi:hypothetical protein